MRAVVQRVKKANVVINNKKFSEIKEGLVVLLGISESDKEDDINYIIDKIINLRIFNDENNIMNNSISSINGEILIISQFTLYGDARKGRRPSYSKAAKQDKAELIYDDFIKNIKQKYIFKKIFTGKFRAMMDINLTSNGPVTILLDSERNF